MVTFLFFWLFGGFYLFMDVTGRPKWLLQYKIQDGTNQPVSYRIQTSKHNFGHEVLKTSQEPWKSSTITKVLARRVSSRPMDPHFWKKYKEIYLYTYDDESIFHDNNI